MKICGILFLFLSWFFLASTFSLFTQSNQSDLYFLLLLSVLRYVVLYKVVDVAGEMCFTFIISSCQQFKTFQFGFRRTFFSSLYVWHSFLLLFFFFLFFQFVVVVVIFVRLYRECEKQHWNTEQSIMQNTNM